MSEELARRNVMNPAPGQNPGSWPPQVKSKKGTFLTAQEYAARLKRAKRIRAPRRPARISRK